MYNKWVKLTVETNRWGMSPTREEQESTLEKEEQARLDKEKRIKANHDAFDEWTHEAEWKDFLNLQIKKKVKKEKKLERKRMFERLKMSE